jgi:hypothetical protein
MKKLMKTLEDIMVAITFAEAGEYDEASRLSGIALQQHDVSTLQDFRKAGSKAQGNKSIEFML